MHTRLKTVLDLRRISQEKLAEMTGLSRKTIGRAANGGIVNPATKKLIAIKLGEPEAELFMPENIPSSIFGGQP